MGAQSLSRVQLFVTAWTAYTLLGSSVYGIFQSKNTGAGFHFHSVDLPDPGINPTSLTSAAFAGGFFTTVPPGKPNIDTLYTAAAAAAKSLQLCPTLCDPIDSGPPGSPIPGILQARMLEWVAMSFSNVGK